MSVYKLPKVNLRLDELIDAVSDKPVIKPMQIARTGKFYDERYGTFNVTRKMFEEMIANFQTGVRGIIPALDYKHDADDIAAGWFKKLEIKDVGNESQLWGDIEITPRCQKVLADKEFGYLSIDMDTDYKCNESGKKFGCVLLGAGLTNRPVIKKMSPAIQLSDTKQGEHMDPKEKELADLKTAKEANDKKLADAGVADLDGLIKMIADLKSQLEALKAGGGAAAPAKEEEAQMGEVKAELAEVRKKLELAEKKTQESAKENEFNKMLAEGKVCAAQREHFLKGDMVKFAENAQKLKLKEDGSADNGQDAEEKDCEDEIQEKAMKLAEEKKISFKEAVSSVLKSNPKLAEQRKQKYKGE